MTKMTIIIKITITSEHWRIGWPLLIVLWLLPKLSLKISKFQQCEKIITAWLKVQGCKNLATSKKRSSWVFLHHMWVNLEQHLEQCWRSNYCVIMELYCIRVGGCRGPVFHPTCLELTFKSHLMAEKEIDWKTLTWLVVFFFLTYTGH